MFLMVSVLFVCFRGEIGVDSEMGFVEFIWGSGAG